MAKQSGISISGKSKSDVLNVFCELLDNRKNNSLPKSEKKSVKPFSCKKENVIQLVMMECVDMRKVKNARKVKELLRAATFKVAVKRDDDWFLERNHTQNGKMPDVQLLANGDCYKLWVTGKNSAIRV